jgi:hypothetical protein
MAYEIQRGENIVFLVDDTAIECLTQSDFSSSASTIDTTCKNAAGATSSEVGAITASFSIGGNYTEGTGSNEDFQTLYVLHKGRTSFTGTWGGVDVGDKTISGVCKILSISASAPNTGNLVTWTAEVEVSGDTTVATVV